MLFRKCLSVLQAVALIGALALPLDTAYAAAVFSSANTWSRIKNVTNGDSSANATASAIPGNTVSLYLRASNSGDATATETIMTVPPSEYFTYNAHSTRVSWNSASNSVNSSTGAVYFTPLYVDADSGGTISANDIRVNWYGWNAAATGGKYAQDTLVVGGDADSGKALTGSTVDYVYITGGDAAYASGDKAYAKGTGNNTLTAVQVGDIRINPNGSYIPGSIVVSGDADICTGCLTQATNVKRLDDGNTGNDTLYPFDEGGMPLGDMGVSKQFLVKESQFIVNSNAPAQIVTTLTVSATGVTSQSNASTLNVDTTPSVTAVAVNPTSIANDGAATTTMTATVTDKNGASDVTGVTADLSFIGGSATATMYDDGSNGDAVAGDYTFTLSGIATTVVAGTYTVSARATDSTAQTATNSTSLIVQPGGAPTITINSTTPSTVGAAGTVAIAWQANESVWQYAVKLGSCAGSAATGTNVAGGDGLSETLAAATPITTTLDNSNFSGSTNVYICAYDADATLGQAFATVIKDTTAPVPAVTFTSRSNITVGETVSITWNADEAGTYALKVGSCSGSTVTGSNASGSYTSGSVVSVATVSDLAEGANTLYVCVTDAAGNSGSATSSTVTKDATAPSAVTGVTLVDGDAVADGVDGRDFTVSWTPAANDSTFQNYRVYLLPSGVTLDTNIHTHVASVSTQATATWTGTNSTTNDSAGTALAAGSYAAYVIARDAAGLASSSAASAAATITLDDTSAPTFSSATTVDANTVRLTFSEAISFVDSSKVTIPSATIDTSYNSDGYTNGVRISPSDARNVNVRVSTIATSYTTAALALGACAVRDVSGSSSLNVAGNCADAVTTTNANAAVTGLSISDGAKPVLTLTSPASSAADNASFAVAYTLSEEVTAGTLQLKFTASGGTTDSASPHTITLTDALVGSANTAGSKSFSLNAASFTSTERGAGDTLVNGTIYTVQLSGSDLANNAADPVSSGSVTYDTSAPSAPVATQGFGSPTANTAPTLTWGTVTGAVSYTVELSLQIANFSPAVATQTQAGTSWQVSPAFATDGSADGTYIWRVYATDSAGNVSVASNQPTFVLTTQTDAPSLLLADTTNTSQTATNAQTVSAVLDGYSVNATHYLLSESQSTAPALGDGGWIALPGGAPQTVSFTLSAGEGSKTVYAWVKDALGNVSATAGTASISYDTTALSAATITAVDADGGAESGKTNAAAVTVAVSNDTGAVKWCIRSDDTADGAPSAPDETTCTAPAGGAASGWVSVRPTTYTLASTGAKTLYVYTQDAAGNVSAAGTVAIDYQTATPTAPTVSMTDTTTLSTSYTTSTTVNVITTGTYYRCIVSTSQASLPTENSGSWQATCPTTLSLGSGDGVKTAYVWIKDAYGNRYTSQVTGSITLDTTKPTFSVRKTQDLDSDGQIDAVQVTMSENIQDGTLSLAQFALAGYTLTSYTGTLGLLTFTNGISVGTVSNDQIFYLAVTEGGSQDTAAVPALSYTAGGLADAAGNTALSASAATTDGVAPRVITTNPLRVYDADGDGLADSVRVVYSEAVATPTLTSPWTLANVPSGGTLASVGRGTTLLSNDSIVLTLTEGSSGVSTDVGSFTLALTNTSGDVKDAANNAASTFTATAAADYMGPVLVSANYIDTGSLATSSIVATFSESVTDAGVAVSDFTLAGGGSLGSASIDTGATANDATVSLVNLSSGAPTVGTSTLALSGSGVVTDATAQTNASIGTATVTVRGGIVINEVAYAGYASNAADDYVELRNMSAGTSINFASDPHIVCVGSSTVIGLSSGTLSASGYFLAAHLAAGSSALNTAPDATGFTTGIASGDTVTLRTGSSCSAGTVLDSATITGTKGAANAAMERNSTPGDGTQAASWYTAVASTNMDSASYKGTPKAVNVQDSTAPTFTTASFFPLHQSLLPASPVTLKAVYADNAEGLGINTAAVTMEVDINGDADYADASEATLCSGGALSVSATQAVCTLSQQLGSGRHSVRVTAYDLAGNSVVTSTDFWIDALTVTVENADQANLGTVAVGSPVQLADENSKLTKITVRTYGAAVTLAGSPSGTFDSGASQIAWPSATNKSSLVVGTDTGSWYRVKEGAAGAYGNYVNFSDTPTVATKNALTGSTLATANALQTYTFYIQYYVDVPSLQAAGVYTQNVAYLVTPSY